MGNFGSQVYSDSAGAGNIFTAFGLVIGIIIGLIMVIVGIYFIFKKNSKTDSVIASVQNVACNPYTANNTTNWSCSFNVTFTPKGKTNPITVNVQTDSSINYSGITNIKIWYDPNDPTNISLNNFNYKTIGIILIILSLFIVGISYFWYWAARKNKFIASAAGTSGALSLLSGGRIGGIV